MRNHFTQLEVIDRFNSVHNHKYDYTKLTYKNDNTKCCIICPKHGEFWQTPGMHFRFKQGCRRCSIEKRKEETNKKYEIKLLGFLQEKNNRNYSLQERYKGMLQKISIKCLKHNLLFTTQPVALIAGFKCCPECSKELHGEKTREKRKQCFLQNAIKTHGERYDYSKVVFRSVSEKVCIGCKIHGDFLQQPSMHVAPQANGCPACNITRGEELIAIFLNINKIPFIFQYRIEIDNSFHYFDFYLPKNNIIISFNGKQHYVPVKFFGGKKAFQILVERDDIKNRYCKENNIRHLIIDYTQAKIIDNILNRIIINKEERYHG